jgi:hypothetical protein
VSNTQRLSSNSLEVACLHPKPLANTFLLLNDISSPEADLLSYLSTAEEALLQRPDHFLNSDCKEAEAPMCLNYGR